MTNVTIPISIMTTALFLHGCGGGAAPQDTQPAPPPAAASAAPEPGSSGQDTGKITARSALDQVRAQAATWQPDAQLVGVTTSLADGPAHDFWFYDFQSPSKGTCTRIRAIAGGRVENAGSGNECVLVKPLSVGFVDSPAAYEAARAAGFQKGESVQFGLRVQRDKNLPAPRECWVVWSDADGDEEKGIIRGWCIDPATGGFITRLSGYGRIEPLK